jgi:hypothetical protein
MADTTIKVDTAVRDRLAVLASERGMTIRDFVEHLASSTPTEDDMQRRQAEAIAYVKAHFVPDFNDDDLAAGEAMWRHIAAVRQLPEPGNYPFP